jgi:hypothetical protein
MAAIMMMVLHISKKMLGAALFLFLKKKVGSGDGSYIERPSFGATPAF